MEWFDRARKSQLEEEPDRKATSSREPPHGKDWQTEDERAMESAQQQAC